MNFFFFGQIIQNIENGYLIWIKLYTKQKKAQICIHSDFLLPKVTPGRIFLGNKASGPASVIGKPGEEPAQG